MDEEQTECPDTDPASAMRLPVEILSHILKFAPFEDQVNLMTVSHLWYEAALFAMKQQKGFIIGMCMGNKPFCDGIRRIGFLEQLSEQAVRKSQFVPDGQTESETRSRLAIVCPNVEILCDSGCDTVVSMLLIREYRATLTYLQMDSYVKKLHQVGVFPVLKYLKFPKLSRHIVSLKDTFPVLEYMDGNWLNSGQIRSLPVHLKGLKLYHSDEDTVHFIGESAAAATLQVLHIITNRVTTQVETFCLPNITDVSFRGLEEMGNLFVSLSRSQKIQKLHISARTCVTVDQSSMLNMFAQLRHLTSLNLRFIILPDPVPFWAQMVALLSHKLQHLTFSTHFVTSESLNVMAGFAALQTFSLTFIYDQPFLYNNVPENLRNRRPFTAADLLQFFRSPTASKAILRDVSIHMQSLGSDRQVISDLEAELQQMKEHHCLEMAEVKEVGNRNSIFV